MSYERDWDYVSPLQSLFNRLYWRERRAEFSGYYELASIIEKFEKLTGMRYLSEDDMWEFAWAHYPQGLATAVARDRVRDVLIRLRPAFESPRRRYYLKRNVVRTLHGIPRPRLRRLACRCCGFRYGHRRREVEWHNSLFISLKRGYTIISDYPTCSERCYRKALARETEVIEAEQKEKACLKEARSKLRQARKMLRQMTNPHEV